MSWKALLSLSSLLLLLSLLNLHAQLDIIRNSCQHPACGGHTPTLPDNARLSQSIYSCRMRSPVRRRVSRGRSPLPPIRAGQRRPSDLRIDENTRALFLQVCCVSSCLSSVYSARILLRIQSVSVVWHLAPHESIVFLALTAIPAWDLCTAQPSLLFTASYSVLLWNQFAAFIRQGFAVCLRA